MLCCLPGAMTTHMNYPYGLHAALPSTVVPGLRHEIHDRLRYRLCDQPDAGEGHGRVVQPRVGGALFEESAHDGSGQPLSSTSLITSCRVQRKYRRGVLTEDAPNLNPPGSKAWVRAGSMLLALRQLCTDDALGAAR